MKTIIALSLLAALVAAEAPSNSYLPPSPSSRNSGYPSGAPQVIAARSFNQQAARAGARPSGLLRNAPQDHSQFGHNAAAAGRLGAEPGYGLQGAGAFGRNLEASEPAHYQFGYSVNDDVEGTDFGHQEQREEERAQGEYHVVLPDGRKQTVSYEADERGFKPKISYEDTENQGGYDNNGQQISSRGFGHDAFEHGANGGGYHGNHDSGVGIHGNNDGGFGSHGKNGDSFDSHGRNGVSSNHGNGRQGY